MTIRKVAKQISMIRLTRRSDLEDSSFGSTVTAEQPLKHPIDEIATSKQKLVRFDLTQNKEHKPQVMADDQEVTSTWYSASENKAFKRSYMELANTFIAHDRASVSDPHAFKGLLEKVFQKCLIATTEDLHECFLRHADEQILKRWLKKGARRGIVRATVKSIFADKAARRQTILYAVLDAQKQYEGQNADAKAEIIRSVAERISRPSRLFARRLAHC